MSKFVLLAVFTAFFAINIFAQQNDKMPLLIGRVAHNQSSIAFTFAGKIWLVPKAGGAARRLTNTENEETNPVFSPDGRQIAFSRLNGGDWDVYVAAADGSGEAKRITMMPENDYLVAWTPDGNEVVFETTRDEETVVRFYKMNVANPTLATDLPLPQGIEGAFSPDGKSIAYNPRQFVFGEWRYYRGGMSAPIWITNLGSGATEKLPNQNFNDRNPMWLGDKIYFVSDRSGIFNLFSYDRKTRAAKQLTKFDGQGIRHASGAGSEISFVQDGRIHLFDLGTGTDKIVNVSVTPDTSELLPKNANAMRFLEQILPSATGEKIAFGARGEVLVFDPKTGEYKNLTNTSNAAERYPVISPDGKQIAYFSDETGEYFLHIRSLETDAVKKIAIEKQPSFYWNPVWSPDSKKLVFNDRRLNLWLADKDGAVTKIDTSDYSSQDNWAASFSPDSRFLTYAKRLKNRAGTVFIYDAAQRKSFQITDGKTHTQSPVFDANGKYLYFVSSPNALTSEFDWGVLNGEMARPLVVRRVHALILSKDAPSPFLPNRQPNAEAKPAESAAPVKIDFTNLESRFVDLPLPPRDYNRLAAGKPGKVLLVVDEWQNTPGDFNSRVQAQALYSFDSAKPNGLEKIVDFIDAVDITADGGRILYRKGRDYFLTSAEGAVKEGDGKQDFSRMEVKINPAEEWRQIFHESTRLMRDWFYDPNLHGQNLKALENYYARYLPAITRRNDLNSLIGRMLGSVSVSHFGIGGGDAPPPFGRGSGIGLLGADYAIENGRYRFKKIYRATSYASVNGRFGAPLDAPGIDVREGDYLLEVNGAKVDGTKNILGYFENTAQKPTKITVSANADGSSARTFTVYPGVGENRLRRANWAENNRKKVEKLSGGKLGYIFIENYDADGVMNAIRGLTANSDKAGVIIDQRFNGGGITPDFLIEWLRRKSLYNYMFRGGEDIPTPVNPAPPVKVMIVNEWNGSAAETGALMFKLGKVGAVVGKRTSGGGIGPYFFTPRFVDNGRVQIPNRAAYNPDGTSWGIENFGVEPDFDVEIMPQDFIAGRDPQLEKAVAVALAQIAKNPAQPSKRPVFPVHPGKQETPLSDSILPVPGSAFPLPVPKAEVKAVTNGKFAEFLGQFDTPMGVITFSQEGEKLIGLAGGERIELSADASVKDKFSAQTASVTVTFERDAGGKISGLTIVIPSGRELKGRKIN
ncbi:MAG TPA: PDZ domain-containing protein [Pyrinomonadaceae bacterium]|jgi:tricorn protease